MFVSKDVSFNSTLNVAAAATLNSTLAVTGITTLSDNLYVVKDASLNSKLFVSKDVSFNSTLNVAAAATLNSTLAVTGITTLSDNLYVVKDASLNSKLFVSGDVSFNSNVDISGNLNIKGNLAVFQQRTNSIINTTINNYEILSTKDISLNGNLVVSADVSLNSKLFVSKDVSFNGNLVVGGAMNNAFIFRKNDSIMLTCSGDNIPYYTSSFSPKESVYIGYNAGAGLRTSANSITDITGSNYYNTFVGSNAGSLNTSLKNTFIGSNAGLICTSGYNNTYVGEFSGASTTTGFRNTLLGSGAGYNITTGNHNTCIGLYADLSGTLQTATQYNYSTAIGYNAKITGNNQVVLGDTANTNTTAITNIMLANAFRASSDYRIKDNVISLADCSFVVDPLRPVTYHNKVTNQQDIGLIAHEVQEHFPFMVNGTKDGEETQSVNYTSLIGLLIHEIKVLKQNQIQPDVIPNLQKHIQNLEERLRLLEK